MPNFRNPKGIVYKTKKGSIGVCVDITSLKKVPTWGESFDENYREFYINEKDNGKFGMFEIHDDELPDDDQDVPF